MFNLLSFVFSPHQWVELFTFYGGGKDGGDAPDYSQMAAASEKAAQLGKELGEAQLAQNQKQYDQNMAVAAPVINAQLGVMNMTTEQGNDYFNYMKSYARPVEQQLYYEAMGFTPEEVQQIEALRTSETTAVNAVNQAKAAASSVPSFINLPTSSVKTVLPDGALKGDTIKNGKVVEGYTKDTTQYAIGWQGKPGTFATQPVYGTVDANSYYVKNPDGTYKTVTPTYTTENGTQQVEMPSQQAAASSSVIDTPETNALTANLSMQAKARMDATDKDERDGILAKNQELEGRVGETNTQVYNRYANDIEAESGQAVADSRAGFTNAINVAARQGLRYGFSPSKLASMAGTQSVQQAGAQAGAANQTRKAATETMYGRGVGAAGEALKGVTNNRNLRIQDSAIATAKKQDVAGLYRNLPSASQGSYSLATNAGNSAVNNQNSTSNQYMQGISQGNGTIMQGQQMGLSGLSSALQGQASMYNAQQGSGDAIWGALGQVGGAAASKWITSDEKVKKDIKPIDDDAALEGIKKTKISKWKYDPDKVQDAELVNDDKEHIGGMAQDLQKNLGNQVSNGKMVDIISAVGVTMAATKALAKKVDKMEKRK